MDKRKLPTWIEAVGLIGLIIDATLVLAVLGYLLDKHCEVFLKILLYTLCGLLVLAGLIYGVWLIVRKYKLTKIKDNN